MNIYGPYFSDTELGINDTIAQVSRENMYRLVKFGLDPIRKKFGPVTITSGLRSPEHNMQVGGVEGSQHCTGEAVDFVCANQDMRQVFEWVRTWWPGQLFFYAIKGHCHIALPNMALQSKGRLYSMVFEDK